MLAKELKIANIMQQRAFITEAIKKHMRCSDGDPSFGYIGQLFKENIEYFRNEGFDITSFEPGTLPETKYMPLHIFVVDESKVKLSDEEWDEAKKINLEDIPNSSSFGDVLASLFGGPHIEDVDIDDDLDDYGNDDDDGDAYDDEEDEIL